MTQDKVTRTLLIKTKREGDLQVEIPETWKITFGPLSQGGYAEGNALRLYESDKQQRACFVDVLSFRDLSIPVKRKVKKVEESSKRKRDSKGNSAVAETISVDDGEWEDA